MDEKPALESVSQEKKPKRGNAISEKVSQNHSKRCEAIAEYRGKYTELELKERGVGKFFDTQTKQWDAKLRTYHDEEVKGSYLAIRRSLILLFTDAADYNYHEVAHQGAQIMIDRFLVLRSKGTAVVLPGPVISESSLQTVQKAQSGGKGILKATAKRSDFTKWDGKIDTVSDINWIYNNLMVADVTAEDAPSPGAWAHLMYHRSTTGAMAEFFTKVYPRLIPSKSVMQKLEDKAHDDGRTAFSLIDRLLKECAGNGG